MIDCRLLKVVARSAFLVLLLVPGTGWMGGAMATGSSCHSIKDWDARHRCLAEVRGNYSYCHAIRDHDGRKLCLAKTKRQRGYCHSIRDESERKRCLVIVH